jgi:CheY-like chemotaxis protein
MHRILIADDDPDFVETTRIVLESHGHQVSTAASGDEALKAMRADPPDLVLLDVMMSSVLDGLSVTYAAKSDPKLKGIPVIMISSIGSSPQADMFPTDEYIPIEAWMAKPVAPDDLLKKIAKLLQP